MDRAGPCRKQERRHYRCGVASAQLGAVRLSGSEATPRWRGRLHLGALVLAVPAAFAISWHGRSAALFAYSTVLVALFAMSAYYHVLPHSPERRRLLRRLDHSMIYLYMAVAYTPFCLDALGGTGGLALLSAAWAGAAAGIALKLFRFDSSRVLTGGLYMLVGWLIVLGLPETVRALGSVDLGLFSAMGVCYTGGAAVLAARRPDPRPGVFGYHEVWHAAVVLGCACYFALIWRVAG